MPKTVQKPKPAPQKQEVEQVAPKAEVDAQRLKDEMDAMLDEIDAVLEENAEEFVKGYIQKGGQ